MDETPALRRSVPGGIWSIVAPRRSARPQRSSAGVVPAPAHCHFCPGNERETEPEVFALREPQSARDTPGWTVRVVPNKYPAMQPHAGTLDAAIAPYRQLPARGLHEVIVETPRHDRRLVDFDAAELAMILDVYQSRLQAVSAAPHVKSVALFRNEGAAAGASQEHAHAQLVALPIVPGRLAGELRGASAYFRRLHRCVTCDSISRESSGGHRLVGENADFAAMASFAPRFPYETWIVPRRHQHDFRGAEPAEIRNLGRLLHAVLRALGLVLDPFPFNLVLQTAPVRPRASIRRAFHWRLEIVPRLTTASGFELGSGVFIVAVSPEQAARRLRAAITASAPDHRPADSTE
ncbi:MAG TPA: DUF4921 family protein [Vicinamibacterales bacterium]|nr:DUF4921 family protein [Vicinamibacterales bacterium]